jgi:hypothetical protein
MHKCCNDIPIIFDDIVGATVVRHASVQWQVGVINPHHKNKFKIKMNPSLKINQKLKWTYDPHTKIKVDPSCKK